MCLMQHGAVRIGSDSASAIRICKRLHGIADWCRTLLDGDPRKDRCFRSPLGKLHFELIKNGDLISRIWKAIMSRGPEAVAFAKVKGHATREDIEQGRVTVAEKRQ